MVLPDVSEPIYQFVKGVGWVTGPEERFIEFTFRCGTRCKMIDRLPKAGERYRSTDVDYEKFVIDGKANLESWAEYLDDVKFSTCGTIRNTDALNTKRTYYVTVVPI